MTIDREPRIPPLAVSADGRFLVEVPSGTRFEWVADTAWYMRKLDLDAMDRYIADRHERGFTVIQGPLLVDGGFKNGVLEPLSPNVHSDLPLVIDGQTLPLPPGAPIVLNEPYFGMIDHAVAECARVGLYVVLAAIWGSNFKHVIDDVRQAFDLGYQLGKRYLGNDHVIWIACGEYHKLAWEERPNDRLILNEHELGLVDAVARGLRTATAGRNLLTVHPDSGHSSSEHWHDADWLDFNMIQMFQPTGKGRLVAHDWSLSPAKPTILAEPGYEGRSLRDVPTDPVTPWLVRYEAWSNVLAGGFGHTYGDWWIWQFDEAWPSHLGDPGAIAMAHLRSLLHVRPLELREPSPGLIVGDAGTYDAFDRVTAARAKDGSFALVYFPRTTISKEIRIDMLRAARIDAWWYSPRDGGIYQQDGSPGGGPFATLAGPTEPIVRFEPPPSQPDDDWVLVLDDADAGLVAAGRLA